MSREILFRAKRTDNGEWVEGFYTNVEGGHYIVPPIVEWDDDVNMEMPQVIQIAPETISQYTGLTDKNREEIWENDICIIACDNIDEKDGYFVVKWDDDAARFAIDGEGLVVDFDNICGYECEVVGNMFDNPELLEDGD
ncbi:YopX family protein [Frisingicoccus sp.]|uniref:YopX family protein n=1 Tax=Frisingicoccus sp. TaxID=1918627 RepID=UPI003AB55693